MMPQLPDALRKLAIARYESQLVEAATRPGGPSTDDLDQIERMARLLELTAPTDQKRRRAVMQGLVIMAGGVAATVFLLPSPPVSLSGETAAKTVSLTLDGDLSMTARAAVIQQLMIFGAPRLDAQLPGVASSVTAGGITRFSIVPAQRSRPNVSVAPIRFPRGTTVSFVALGQGRYRIIADESPVRVEVTAIDRSTVSTEKGTVALPANSAVAVTAAEPVRTEWTFGDLVEPAFNPFSASRLDFEDRNLITEAERVHEKGGSSILAGNVTVESSSEPTVPLHPHDTLSFGAKTRVLVSSLILQPEAVLLRWRVVGGDVSLWKDGEEQSLRPSLARWLKYDTTVRDVFAATVWTVSFVLGLARWLREPR
jgi:hypothetical protein